MPQQHDETREAFRRVLADPLGQEGYGVVADWHRVLMSDFPLWSFQAWAFADFQSTQLPANYPLQQMIGSIVSDEGIAPRGATAGPSKRLNPLECAVDRRRYVLADHGRTGPPGPIVSRTSKPYEKLPLTGCPSKFNSVYPLLLTPGDPDAVATIQQLARARDAAKNVTERKRADAELRALLKSMAARSPGKPSEMPNVAVLEALVDQGKRLLRLCWQEPPRTVTARTNMILFDHGVEDLGEQKLWIARLALPVFSKPEIQALFSERKRAYDLAAESSRRRTFGERRTLTPRPTALRFTFWVLAHRLGFGARALARKAAGGKTVEYLKGRRNPIKSFVVK